MMQGDAYFVPFQILNNAGSVVTPEDVLDVEITVNRLSKTYKNIQVIYEDGWWLFPLSQEETFKMIPSSVKAQVRIVWANGVVEGHEVFGGRIFESQSKEVL